MMLCGIKNRINWVECVENDCDVAEGAHRGAV